MFLPQQENEQIGLNSFGNNVIYNDLNIFVKEFNPTLKPPPNKS